MARYPHTKLFTNAHRTVVLSGPYIQVLETQTGRVLHSNFVARENEDTPLNSGPIRCSGVDKDGKFIATVGDDKRLKIWDLEQLTLLSSRELPKKPTSIQFTRSADILVSDKFGDVFRYTLSHTSNEVVSEKSASNALASHENPSGGELILGHASLLTSCLLTPDEKFLVTADRDEHIRISWYPQGYVIESYCLGHTKYVSAIHIPDALPTSLVSGGGDPELKVWDWMTGRLQRNIEILAVVEPYIKVTTQNKGHEWPQGNDDEEDTTKAGSGKKKGRKGKRRDAPSVELEDSKVHPFSDPDATGKTLVVRKIESFLSGGETHVVFSAVGATAIFEFVLTEAEDQLEIHHHDFGKPVIDFTLCEEGVVWVLLDADFPEGSDMSDEPPRKLVQAIQWSKDHIFLDVGSSTLLDSLNTLCCLSATAGDLKTLDLYSDLSSLPKSIHGEQEGQVDERLDRPPPDEPGAESASSSIGLTKRALGRLKHKRALGQLHEQSDGGPNAKKTKTDSDDEEAT